MKYSFWDSPTGRRHGRKPIPTLSAFWDHSIHCKLVFDWRQNSLVSGVEENATSACAVAVTGEDVTKVKIGGSASTGLERYVRTCASLPCLPCSPSHGGLGSHLRGLPSLLERSLEHLSNFFRGSLLKNTDQTSRLDRRLGFLGRRGVGLGKSARGSPRPCDLVFVWRGRPLHLYVC
jgi:hypothetical protein